MRAIFTITSTIRRAWSRRAVRTAAGKPPAAGNGTESVPYGPGTQFSNWASGRTARYHSFQYWISSWSRSGVSSWVTGRRPGVRVNCRSAIDVWSTTVASGSPST